MELSKQTTSQLSVWMLQVSSERVKPFWISYWGMKFQCLINISTPLNYLVCWQTWTVLAMNELRSWLPRTKARNLRIFFWKVFDMTNSVTNQLNWYPIELTENWNFDFDLSLNITFNRQLILTNKCSILDVCFHWNNGLVCASIMQSTLMQLCSMGRGGWTG